MPAKEPSSTAAYVAEQDLQAILEAALQQVVREQPAEGARRMAEIMMKAAHDRENTQRMRKLFAQADTDGDGTIDEAELGIFQAKMGEPLTPADLSAAYSSMGGTADKEVGFEAFVEWYEGARKRGGALARKGDAATRRKSRVSRFSRFSHEIEESFNIAACRAIPVGEPKTLEYRVGLHYPDPNAKDGALKQISPWHDVPLYPSDVPPAAGEVHMIVEIPKFSRAKFEIATGEASAPTGIRLALHDAASSPLCHG